MLLSIQLLMIIVSDLVPSCGEMLWIDMVIWVNFGFCIITIVESCFVIHIVYRGVGIVQEGLGEFIDGWARILIPGAYVISLSTIMSMEMNDGYKDDGMAQMYSAMGDDPKFPKVTFLPQVVIAPVLVVLWIGLYIAYKGGTNAFHPKKSMGEDGTGLQSTVRKSLHMITLAEATTQAAVVRSLNMRLEAQEVAITRDNSAAADTSVQSPPASASSASRTVTASSV